MNYEKIYEDFIENRKGKQPPHLKDGSSELHHIIPKSFGGSNNKENLIRLKTSEHVFAHMLLAKIYGGKMWFALTRMLSSQQGRISNKKHRIIFEKSRKEAAEYHSKTRKGKKLNLSQEQLEKRSERMKGDKNPMFGKVGANKGKIWDEKTKKKFSEAKMGDKNPNFGKKHDGRFAGDKNPNFGKKTSEEAKQKMREKILDQPKVTCPHCQKIGFNAPMRRWHFENCKYTSLS